MAAISTTEETLAVINAFNEAFNRHDVDAVMALMTDDVIFENTGPAPDGSIFVGQDAVRAVWNDLFSGSPNARFDAEEVVAMNDRCVVRWRYTWSPSESPPGHVRGVDVFRVRDGKVAEKLAYVKG
jgi:ketosteroid isomerase-like protein